MFRRKSKGPRCKVFVVGDGFPLIVNLTASEVERRIENHSSTRPFIVLPTLGVYARVNPTRVSLIIPVL